MHALSVSGADGAECAPRDDDDCMFTTSDTHLNRASGRLHITRAAGYAFGELVLVFPAADATRDVALARILSCRARGNLERVVVARGRGISCVCFYALTELPVGTRLSYNPRHPWCRAVCSSASARVPEVPTRAHCDACGTMTLVRLNSPTPTFAETVPSIASGITPVAARHTAHIRQEDGVRHADDPHAERARAGARDVALQPRELLMCAACRSAPPRLDSFAPCHCEDPTARSSAPDWHSATVCCACGRATGTRDVYFVCTRCGAHATRPPRPRIPDLGVLVYSDATCLSLLCAGTFEEHPDVRALCCTAAGTAFVQHLLHGLPLLFLPARGDFNTTMRQVVSVFSTVMRLTDDSLARIQHGCDILDALLSYVALRIEQQQLAGAHHTTVAFVESMQRHRSEYMAHNEAATEMARATPASFRRFVLDRFVRADRNIDRLKENMRAEVHGYWKFAIESLQFMGGALLCQTRGMLVTEDGGAAV